MHPSDWIALAALAVAAFGLWLSARTADRQRQASERTARQRDAAQVLGPTMVLLVDVNPVRWALTAGPGAQARADELNERWKTKVREQLLAIAASYPTARERKLANDLDVALHNVMVSSLQYGVNLPSVEQPWTLERAQAHWEAASALAEELAAAVRGDPPSRG